MRVKRSGSKKVGLAKNGAGAKRGVDEILAVGAKKGTGIKKGAQVKMERKQTEEKM